MTGYSLASHITDEQVHLYAHGQVDGIDLLAIEQHLVICGPCRSRVDQVVRLNSRAPADRYETIARHHTGRGWVDLFLVTNGREWMGRVVDDVLDCARTAETRDGAIAYCNRSFGKMYPEHWCTTKCVFVDAHAERFDR